MLRQYAALFMIVSLVYMPAHSQKGSGIHAGKNQWLNYPKQLPIVEPHLAVNPNNSNHMVAAAMVYDSYSYPYCCVCNKRQW
jgi:hypothetical protein